jgi:transposase-like protein
MKHQNNSNKDDRAADIAASTPSQCPACKSTEVKTTSKVANTESYWRCEACGEVWNVERLRAANYHNSSNPWRR